MSKRTTADWIRVSKDRLVGMESTGVHANSVTNFGTRLGVEDPEAIIAAHGLCNNYGLDMDTTSGVIASWAMEAFQRQVVVYYERLRTVLDSLGVCYFISDWMDPGLPTLEAYSEALSAMCGYDTSAEELLLIGERIHTLGRLLNVAYAGFSRADDYPPSRLMSSPIETGDVLSKCEWDRLLDHYYDLHEWNPVTGWPTHQRLVELGLDGYKWALKHKLEGLG